jgi:hypothetical protein
MSPRLTIFASILLISAPATVRAELVNLAWSAGGTFTYQTRIAAGRFVEVCGPLPAGLNLAWQFRTSAPIDFNIHYHQGKDVLFPARMSRVDKASDTLRVEVKQDYCWMWSNKTAATVELKAGLQR